MFDNRHKVRPVRRLFGFGAVTQSARRARRWVALTVVGLAFAVPVLAARSAGLPPAFQPGVFVLATHATRAHVIVKVAAGGELPIKWHAEYATSEQLLAEGKGIVAGSGEVLATGSDELDLGTLNAAQARILQHLAPLTTYYARFVAQNNAGEATKTVKFETTAVGPPEPVEEGRGVEGVNHPNRFREVVGSERTTSICFISPLQANGNDSEYAFEYAPSESGPWTAFTTGSPGVLTAAEDFASPGHEACITGLTPETDYFARFKASNASGAVQEVLPFTTPTAKPAVTSGPAVRNVTGTSAYLTAPAEVLPHGSETSWRFEYAPAGTGAWKPVPGAEGTVSQAEAEALEALPEQPVAAPGIEGSLSALSPSTAYDARLSVENKFGSAVTPPESITRFATFGAPAVGTLALHGLHGEALRLMASVNPNSLPTSNEQTVTVEGAPTGGTFTLIFQGQTTAPIAFDASSTDVERALKALSTVASGGVSVDGRPGGPYRVFFLGAMSGVSQPPISADGSSLTPAGSVTVATAFQGGEAYDTHYHFEYVSQRQFEQPGAEGGFAKAASTPEVDPGPGASPIYVGADLPALTAGETYRFRIAATNTSPGDPVVRGEEGTLAVPSASAAGGEAACPNEGLRTGRAARLPDCRAFEQVTPADKEGAQEIFNYGGSAGDGALPAEDGNHLMFSSQFVKWGAGAGAGQSPYFFSRDEGGWRMTAGTAQTEAGVGSDHPQVFTADLTEVGVAAGWQVGPGIRSTTVEYKAGPPGGPYTTVATVPRSLSESPGWVAASEDFSKLILGVVDHHLLGSPTGTKEGSDLYEYSAGGLRQLNVNGAGTTIGSCGASVAHPGGGDDPQSSRYSVSADGSRVFFEAVPGGNCSEPKHLYVRVNGGAEGAETLDIGVYLFLAANADGTHVLLEKSDGENPGLYVYEAGASAPRLLPGSAAVVLAGGSARAASNFAISNDLSSAYFVANGALYHYDVSAGALTFLDQLSGAAIHSASPDGRYVYFTAEGVGGLPGGGLELETPHAGRKGPTFQVYRYDLAEDLVQCVSCASAFNQEPRLSALYTQPGGSGGVFATVQNLPKSTIASADGNYVFFDTPAALVPSDVDGEIAPEANKFQGGEHPSSSYSLSSDIYEWRRDGVGGCALLQGCLALITTGHGGFINILLGASDSGRDVFFATDESLLARDNDTAGDIYDARIGGGFPEPSEPVQCEGDACSSPPAAPNDATPASFTFQGAGNLLATPLSTPPGPAATKPKPKVKCRAKAKRRCRKHKRKARHAAHHRHANKRSSR
jgi:hypothetical protein